MRTNLKLKLYIIIIDNTTLWKKSLTLEIYLI